MLFLLSIPRIQQCQYFPFGVVSHECDSYCMLRLCVRHQMFFQAFDEHSESQKAYNMRMFVGSFGDLCSWQTCLQCFSIDENRCEENWSERASEQLWHNAMTETKHHKRSMLHLFSGVFACEQMPNQFSFDRILFPTHFDNNSEHTCTENYFHFIYAISIEWTQMWICAQCTFQYDASRGKQNRYWLCRKAFSLRAIKYAGNDTLWMQSNVSFWKCSSCFESNIEIFGVKWNL